MENQLGTLLVLGSTAKDLSFITDGLKDSSLEIVSAPDGPDAVAMAHRVSPALILLEMGEAGLETCRQLKADVALREVPVLFLIAVDALHTRIEGFKAGAVDYLIKPVEREELEARVYLHLLFPRDLRESEGKYRSLVENQPLGVVIHRPTGEVVYVNPAMCKILGYGSADELVGKIVLSFVHPDYVPSVVARFQRVFDSENPQPAAEELLIRKDGSFVAAEINGAPTMYAGEPAIQVMVADVTERRTAEQALRESEIKYRSLVENQPVGVVIHRVDGEIVYANPAVLRILGYGHPILGKNVLEFLPPDSITAATARMQALVDGQTQTSIEEPVLHRDGSNVVAAITGTPMMFRGEPAIQLTILDLTERKQAEETRRKLEAQLLRSQKLEAVGQLAGGVAHDFNNILTAILGYVELNIDALRLTLGQHHDAVEAMAEIQKAALRASALTGQLLTFSRRDVMKPAVLKLNAILAGLDPMLRRLISENISLEIVTDPQLDAVLADAGRIEQVIVNLVVNAVHAMPDGGRLILVTGNVTHDELFTRDHSEMQPGPHVMLAVSDTGHGMDAATQERIFEPFFSTKPMDRGSGLGLSTVHGIVRQSGGSILVYSEPGKGTTFKIFLPAVRDPQMASVGAPEDSPAIGGHETLLLCEDDRAVRELTARLLEQAGYRVLVAASGREALRAAELTERIDLLVTDVIMTDMNGRQLSESLQKKIPRLRTLFISGYPSNVLAHHGVLDQDIELLEKPFRVRQLLVRVRELLERP